MRINRQRESDEVDVSMSPLIDCVFLLLIFFLVTTMTKKTERRIPIKQPDATISLSKKKSSEMNYIGLSAEGDIKVPVNKGDREGRIDYATVKDLPTYLKTLSAAGQKDKPLVIQVHRDVELQEVFKVFDICTIQGFTNVKTSLESDNFQYMYKEVKDENTQ